jgi:hypothetical protein
LTEEGASWVPIRACDVEAEFGVDPLGSAGSTVEHLLYNIGLAPGNLLSWPE